MTIILCDEAVPSSQDTRSAPLHLLQPVDTLRDLLRVRVQREVETYNESLPGIFQGLVQPEESERILNGFRLRQGRPLDWETQFSRACSSFERNGFLVLVDDRQILDLDAPLALAAGSRVQFLKLVPLIGG